MVKYNVDYFIKKFKKIPVRNWCIGEFSNKEKTMFCAYGHCGLSDDHMNLILSLMEFQNLNWKVQPYMTKILPLEWPTK